MKNMSDLFALNQSPIQSLVCAGCDQDFIPSENQHRLSLVLGNPRYCDKCRNDNIRIMENSKEVARKKLLAKWIDDKIPYRYQSQTLDSFDISEGSNAQILADLRAWTESLDVRGFPRGARSLLLTREINGVGKTHLALAILRRLMERRSRVEEFCAYEFWPIYQIRQILEESRRFSAEQTQRDIYGRFAKCHLLILDDVGKEMASDYDKRTLHEMYFSIINERYNQDLPLIMTSNVGFEPWKSGAPSLADVIGRAATSRMMEMTGARQYVIAGKDKR